MSDGGMNEWLADFYGTGAGDDELEKAAQAALLEKLSEGDIDIDSLSDDEVVELATELGITDDDAVYDGELDDHQKIAMITKVAEANDIDIAELGEEEFNQLAAIALDPATWEEADGPNDHEKIAMISKLAEASDIDIAELDEDQFNELAAIALNPETWEGGEEQLSDHEKIAMISKVAEANEIDIAELNEYEFNQLAEVALDPATWEEDEQTKEAEAKFAEADFLGRVMAHAQHDELQKLALSPGGVLEAVGKAPGLGGLSKGLGKRLAKRSTSKVTAARESISKELGAFSKKHRAAGPKGLKGDDYKKWQQANVLKDKLKGADLMTAAKGSHATARKIVGGGAIGAGAGLAGLGGLAAYKRR